MRIVFTHNLKVTGGVEEAEFDTRETVDAVARGLREAGFEVEPLDVTGPASRLVARLEALQPDLVFNTAEGQRGRTREAFCPAVLEEMGIPYTCSDPYVLTLTLDKALTKRVVMGHGVVVPRGIFVTEAALAGGILDDFPLPAIVKPNYEGSSIGIDDTSVATTAEELAEIVSARLRQFPAGLLVEELIAGRDVSVAQLDGVGDGLLPPTEIIYSRPASRWNIYDFRSKNEDFASVSVRCPADVTEEQLGTMHRWARRVVDSVGCRDVSRVDFRVANDGRVYFIEVNALPSLEVGAGVLVAAEKMGLNYSATLGKIVESACRRYGMLDRFKERRRSRRGYTVGLVFNLKRVTPNQENPWSDVEAEYDSPKTVDSLEKAIASYGHKVVRFEATPDLPRILADADVDIVFNIAEGIEGRNREAVVPALCELIGIPYTGSDAATMSIALDKSLCKRMLREGGVQTPDFFLITRAAQKLPPKVQYPYILKPIYEGTSKGITAKSVVHDEPTLRMVAEMLIFRYHQPVLAEQYIAGREFTVGLLGTHRPRVLPPMEVKFSADAGAYPVYSFGMKQEWVTEQHYAYECPAKLDDLTRKRIEKVARDAFVAIGCRDVARVDLRMNEKGEIFVIELNPLPGITPGFSDLVQIGAAAGMEYRTLVGEILSGAVKRLREKRRRERILSTRPGVAVPPGGPEAGSEDLTDPSLELPTVDRANGGNGG
ncbi:MAG: ATP-grasp domain-containing protein [Deltaproteobacteria bacterium]|nr:ATP-grasp domain-containing protein [Deltaproteobacteria bacterium]